MFLCCVESLNLFQSKLDFLQIFKVALKAGTCTKWLQKQMTNSSNITLVNKHFCTVNELILYHDCWQVFPQLVVSGLESHYHTSNLSSLQTTTSVSDLFP